MTAQSGVTLEEIRAEPESWGRLVESAVGAHLANAAAAGLCELFYWRDRNREVDFVVRSGRNLTAIEVKSGRSRDALPGLAAFCRGFPAAAQAARGSRRHPGRGVSPAAGGALGEGVGGECWVEGQ